MRHPVRIHFTRRCDVREIGAWPATHRGEQPADEPAAAPIRFHGVDAAVYLGILRHRLHGVHVDGHAAAGVRPDIPEAAADEHAVIGHRNGVDRAIRHPEILARRVGKLLGMAGRLGGQRHAPHESG